MAGVGLVLGSGARDLGIDAGVPIVQRHGDEGYTLPHEIDHVANMRRLLDSGCDRVLAIGSVGGLREELAPGSFVCPDDFIALAARPLTALAGAAAHVVPGFDEAWRSRVAAAFADAVELRDGGVYWQAEGPRLETKAEISLIAAHAHVIGMTVASECVVARELGLAYAAVCVVDNYANGVAQTELTLEELEANRAANRETLARALLAAIPALV